MVAKEVRNLCFDLLKEKLIPLGYKPNKKEGKFRKINEHGFDEVWFGLAEYAALKRYDIYIYISVRVDEIEKLKNLYIKNLSEKAKLESRTCNINCGSFIDNSNLDFVIHTPQDIQNAVERFWNIYQDFGIEHIKKCYDINFLNSIYPKYKKDSNKWFTAASWYIAILTVAYLANKETFIDFRKEFTAYLVDDLKMPENKLIEMNEYLDKIAVMK